ncbi:MAG: amidohydrolase family protein [Chloroflexi bacterium]|nr:amidohydrolase family protein [Chloroflexota bacterium]MDA1272082.1 amidohydrolase family protein [Chloroflexota bacterium]
MAPTGNDWLALTTEETLEPEIPICDPHHHFWVHRPEPIDYQKYLLPELVADVTSGHNVRSTVFIEVRCEYRQDGPEELKPVGEVEFVQSIADDCATGRFGDVRAASAIIGRADLKLGGGVRPVLEAMQSASPNRFRGVRHSVGWDASPELADREIQGALSTTGYRAGAKVLAEMGLILENSLYFPQAAEVVEFARALPELTIVMNHIGGLVRVGPYANRDDEVIPAWRKGVEEMAKCPNIIMKLGGVGQQRFAYGWDERETPIGSEELAESLAPLMDHCIEQFGPDRCMFESNYPVDKISYSYNVLYNAFKRLSKGYSATERAAMFHDTAARVYSIED